MTRRLFAGLGLLALMVAAPAARSEVGFSIFISNAPPPPVVVYRTEPRFDYIPEERVYVIDDDYCDYDFFRYGAYFYIYDNGYWYRSRSYRGPFVAIYADYVPRPIFYVSSYQYRWRQQPRWRSDVSYRYDRDRDRRYRDYSGDRDRRYGGYTSDRGDRRGLLTVREGYRPRDAGTWRNGSPDRDRDEVRSRGNGNGDSRGNGRGKGRGNGRGHGKD